MCIHSTDRTQLSKFCWLGKVNSGDLIPHSLAGNSGFGFQTNKEDISKNSLFWTYFWLFLFFLGCKKIAKRSVLETMARFFLHYWIHLFINYTPSSTIIYYGGNPLMVHWGFTVQPRNLNVDSSVRSTARQRSWALFHGEKLEPGGDETQNEKTQRIQYVIYTVYMWCIKFV